MYSFSGFGQRFYEAGPRCSMAPPSNEKQMCGHRWISEAHTGVRVGHSLLHRFTDSLERKFNKNSSDLGFLNFLRSDPLQCHRLSLLWVGAMKRWLKSLPNADLGVGSALVIQGRKDGTVAWRYNMKAIVRLFPGSEIHYLDEAGHQLANESLAIRERYYAILDQYFFS